MTNSICEKIIMIKNGEKYYLEDIIEIFNPIINKYSRLLNGEDTKQDLIIHLIKVINKIPIDENRYFEEKAILGYIGKAIRNEYIKLSKKADKIRLNENCIDFDIEIGHEEFESELELLDLFKVLNYKESYIIKLIYIYNLSVSEVAEFMQISRQAVNQIKNRALKKLRDIYLN